MRLGITGQEGFIGTHLYNFLKIHSDINIIPFENNYFSDGRKLSEFVKNCDIIVHLAGKNRDENENEIYNSNIQLVKKLIKSFENNSVSPHVVFASSTQESNKSAYGKSKLKARELLENWARINNSVLTSLVIPNVFGPFCKPFYNSFISTFCYQFTHDEEPKIIIDTKKKLIYIDNLVKVIFEILHSKNSGVSVIKIPFDVEKNVSEIFLLLNEFYKKYYLNHIIPDITMPFELALFNTFRSYIEIDNYFPINLVKHQDNRGSFSEIFKSFSGSQISFSTTKPGITRGNHFHTRKIERFVIIKGDALLKLRRIGKEKEFPAFIDIPIWYTHNIQNIGSKEMVTIFCINEFYNPNDPDTFIEKV